MEAEFPDISEFDSQIKIFKKWKQDNQVSSFEAEEVSTSSTIVEGECEHLHCANTIIGLHSTWEKFMLHKFKKQCENTYARIFQAKIKKGVNNPTDYQDTYYLRKLANILKHVTSVSDGELATRNSNLFTEGSKIILRRQHVDWFLAIIRKELASLELETMQN